MRILHGRIRAARNSIALLCACGAPGTLLAVGGAARAQAPISVQLPTYNVFSIDTTVSVPDRGTAVIGGSTSSASGSNQFGGPFIPSTRASGRSTSAGGVTVHAQIHDLDALDRLTLDRAARTTSPSVLGPIAAGRVAAPGADSAPMAGVAELAARRQADLAAQRSEAEEFVVKARDAEAAGKAGVAKLYLQMAARRASNDRKHEIEAMIAKLDAPRPAIAATTSKAAAPAKSSAPIRLDFGPTGSASQLPVTAR